jgi:DNA repair protein RadC
MAGLMADATLPTAGSLRWTEVRLARVRAPKAARIVAHNHPSGNPEPSPEDLALTRRLASAGQTLGISLLDHVIIGATGYVSLAERGLL